MAYCANANYKAAIKDYDKVLEIEPGNERAKRMKLEMQGK
jgi:predicted TPR repeat methyltransferase